MRDRFCAAMVDRSQSTSMVFLTGDLGFMALEPLRDALGPRFINGGVSEQNMFAVAAAMARTGLETWGYSIAPFAYARPFEQIRNDIAFHRLPVKIVGNGGGYGYGVMGPTHHAIEDYGVLLTLTGMQVCVPCFDEDVAAAVSTVGACDRPAYLRLGRGEAPDGFTAPPFAPWRRLTTGGGPLVVVVGPLVGSYLPMTLALPEAERPELWALSMLPIEDFPPPREFLARLAATDRVIVAEEHVRQGGAGSALSLWLATQGLAPRRFEHLHATAQLFDHYGSQTYLRRRSSLDPDSLAALVAP